MISDNTAASTSTGVRLAHGFLCMIAMTIVLVMLANLAFGHIPAITFPLAVIIALAGNAALARRQQISTKQIWITTAISLAVLAAALIIESWYFDLSWDGQWYQQAAIYELGGGWDPLKAPLTTPSGENAPSILHFPKADWYFAAALYRLFHSVEAGKTMHMMMIAAAGGVLFPLCRSFGLSKPRCWIITLLALFNPVVSSELVTHLNDGDLYLALLLYIASSIGWLRERRRIWVSLAMLSVIMLVNTKFTGLVFWCVTALALLLFVIIRHRDRARSFVRIQFATGLVAVGLFGYNPYITNFHLRGNPLYPLLGSKEYPSVFANGQDDNEKYETPVNMRGKPLAVRVFYANFSRPGNAPYNQEDSAELIVPLTGSPKDWTAYHYHETRTSGFGPYFGIALLIASFGLALVTARQKPLRVPVLLFCTALVAALAISRHFWWPRFFPMLWWVPVLALFEAWRSDVGRRWTVPLSLLMVVNALVVFVMHLEWETRSSCALRNELTAIRESRCRVRIDYGAFKRSIEEKLGHWGIPFDPASLDPKDAHTKKLTSVVEGYPNQVLYSIE